jgi:deazaflavin-dependent oxidoreductase (nitroreductase family)
VAVELTPNGTRGQSMPRFPGPLVALFARINVLIYKLFARRRFMGLKLLLLTTVGARTGSVRYATLGCFPEGENTWLIVASAGGAARHPSWFFNLVRHPDKASIEFDGRKTRVRPESLTGAAREAAWRRIVAEAPPYGGYLNKTDREIPIIRLTAVSGSA